MTLRLLGELQASSLSITAVNHGHASDCDPDFVPLFSDCHLLDLAVAGRNRQQKQHALFVEAEAERRSKPDNPLAPPPPTAPTCLPIHK